MCVNPKNHVHELVHVCNSNDKCENRTSSSYIFDFGLVRKSTAETRGAGCGGRWADVEDRALEWAKVVSPALAVLRHTQETLVYI